MNRSRLLLVPVLFTAVAFALPADTLSFHVEPKAKLTKTIESKLTLNSTSFEVSMDGQDMPGGFEPPKITIEDEETVRFVDAYATVADGRATKLTRSFEKLTGKDVQKVQPSEGMGGEENEKTGTKESPFEGKSVVFTWTDDAYKAEWAEGEKGDDDLLDGLEADMDFAGFLSGKAMTKGDSWDVEPKLFNRLSAPSGRLKLSSKSEDDADDQNAAIDEELQKNLGGKAKATYGGTREEGGVQVGVLAIHADLESHGNVDKHESQLELQEKVTLEGELLWDVKAGHLHSLKVSGKIEVTMSIENQVSGGGSDHKLHQKIQFEGDVSHEATVDG